MGGVRLFIICGIQRGSFMSMLMNKFPRWVRRVSGTLIVSIVLMVLAYVGVLEFLFAKFNVLFLFLSPKIKFVFLHFSTLRKLAMMLSRVIDCWKSFWEPSSLGDILILASKSLFRDHSCEDFYSREIP
jgi:hypothetical protein